MIGYIDPTKQAFNEFRGNDREGPIHMLNLVRLREQARYPDGQQTTGAKAPPMVVRAGQYSPAFPISDIPP
jgi:hypothetical protein